MASIVIFEDAAFVDLLPLTYWRPVFELRLGRAKLCDRMTRRSNVEVRAAWTRDWIAAVAAERLRLPVNGPALPGDVLVNGRWVCDRAMIDAVAPCVGECGGEVAYVHCDAGLAARLSADAMLDADRLAAALDGVRRVSVTGWMVRHPWDLVRQVGDALRQEARDIPTIRQSTLSDRVVLENSADIHMASDVSVHPTAVLDAREGPIVIEREVAIGPHAVVQGPATLGRGTKLNPHTWLHGANAIGPMCKLGGEIDGCVFQGFSNKQHAGFLGHSYVGSWVNLGAGTCNSDLKNTYGPVRVPINGREVDTGMQFFGAVIGDHVKTGIGTMIPTGAVLGFAAVIAGGGMIEKFVPSLAWLTGAGRAAGDPARLAKTAEIVMQRRSVTLTEAERALFGRIADLVNKYKKFEAR